MIKNLLGRFKKNNIIIAYKLGFDTLFILTAVLFLWIIVENLIPGIISEKLGFMILTFFITANIIWLIFWGKHLELNSKENKKPWWLFAFSLLCALIFILAFLKVAFIFNLFLTGLIFALGYLLFKETFE